MKANERHLKTMQFMTDKVMELFSSMYNEEKTLPEENFEELRNYVATIETCLMALGKTLNVELYTEDWYEEYIK